MIPNRAAQLASALTLFVALGAAACGGTEPPRPSGPPSGPPSGVVQPVAIERLPPETLTLPNSPTSVKFAVIGDSGGGSKPQREIADQMARYHDTFLFPFTIMVGDNLDDEGPASTKDYRVKFEEPYAALLKDGVRFFATLGNHDDPREVNYEPFNMRGHRYYRFPPPGNPLARLTTQVEFFAIDSTDLDREQLAWLDGALAASTADWKICFLHHPLYTSGRDGAAAVMNRRTLEPLLVKHHVNAVFSGHEHSYQRSTLQNGVQYFISGGARSLRPGDGTAVAYIARTYSQDSHFMLVEIEGDDLHFQAISRTGVTIDAGRLSRVPSKLASVTPADTAARH